MAYNRIDETSFVRVDPNEESALLKKAKNNDAEARSRIVNSYMNMVFKIVKETVVYYLDSASDIDDYISEGVIGLLRAIDTFEESSESKFLSYAYVCVRNKVFIALRKCNKVKNNYSYDYLTDETNEKSATFKGYFVDHSAEEAFSKIENVNVFAKMRDLAWKLPDRERKIILLRYFSDKYELMSQSKIAQSIGITQPRVCRIEKKAILRLRKEMEDVI